MPRPLDVLQKVFTARDTQCIISKRENFGVLKHVFWREFSNQKNRQIKAWVLCVCLCRQILKKAFQTRHLGQGLLTVWWLDYNAIFNVFREISSSIIIAQGACAARSAAALRTLPRYCVWCMFVLRLFPFRALVPCLQLSVVWLLSRSCVLVLSFVVCCSIWVSGGEGKGKFFKQVGPQDSSEVGTAQRHSLCKSRTHAQN